MVKNIKWRKSAVQKSKSRILQLIRSLRSSMSSEEVLKNILAKIEQLSAEKTSMDAEIEMFFYSMHALHHHRRFGA